MWKIYRLATVILSKEKSRLNNEKASDLFESFYNFGNTLSDSKLLLHIVFGMFSVAYNNTCEDIDAQGCIQALLEHCACLIYLKIMLYSDSSQLIDWHWFCAAKSNKNAQVVI